MPYQFLHSTYKRFGKYTEPEGDVVVACLKDIDTGESKLSVLNNPDRKIYVLKKHLWNTFTESKEYVPIRDVDEYVVPNFEMFKHLKTRLGYYVKKYVSPEELLNDPRVFAADIDIEVLIKQKYMQIAEGRMCKEYKVGGLDIETSVIGGNEVILISYTSHNHHIYTGVLQSFLKDGTREQILTLATEKLALFRDALNPIGRKWYDKYPPSVDVFISASELEIIKWIFQKIHEEKDDFIGVWNIAYDIPYLMKRFSFFGQAPENIMCHPDVPTEARVCQYVEDKKEADHWSYKWHMLFLSGYTQFYDAMCLYSRLKRVEGQEASYTLKYIGDKVLGTSKLDFGEDSHRKMQLNRFVEYTVYNMVDSLLVTLMDKVTQNICSLVSLCDTTDLRSFSKQTVQLRNIFHDYCRNKGLVSGCCKGIQTKPYDTEIINIGGGVLSPIRTRNTGVAKLVESDLPTSICIMVSDIDVVLTNMRHPVLVTMR